MTDKELFLKCAKKVDINIGNYTITKVNDYVQVTKFLKKLRENKVPLGMDMASLTCSGDVEIVCEPTGHICLIENDNGCNDYFKFRGLLIINSKLSDSDSAPEMFFEADNDTEWLNSYEQKGYLYPNNDRYLGLVIESEGRVIYDKASIEEYLDLEEDSSYDSEIIAPKVRHIIRNTKREMLVYVNVQGYHNRLDGSAIIHKCSKYTSDDMIRAFKDNYREI